MNRLLWLGLLGAPAADESGGEGVGLVLFVLFMAFLLWLVVAATRKKLRATRRGVEELPEEEAKRTARVWAEARRKAGEEEATEEAEPPAQEVEEEKPDIQQQLLQRAAERRRAREEAAIGRPPEAEEPAVEAPTASVGEPERAEQELQNFVQVPPPAPAAAKPRTLEEGLARTREGFIGKLSRLFGRASLSEEELEQIEEILFTADIGVRTSQKLVDFLQKETSREEKADPRRLLEALKGRIEQMLAVPAPPLDLAKAKPFVILVVGVNGTGKTTTIGKLAMRFRQQGLGVMLAAADTFRAAAQEQLGIWAQRAGAQIVSGQEGADPGAVVFDAITSARRQQLDVVIADTAGRLHTKVNLVEELRKVHRVCGKALEGAPHETWLVLDATTGQNAISQAKEFHQALKLSGIVLTKLDGTAKGGVIIGITDTFGIPVRFIGIGEGVEDLRPFEPGPFVQALFR